ncbi:MAG: SGNH/GDSL hydrolase family protein [Candidatus Rokuibacteriota bacterium]
MTWPRRWLPWVLSLGAVVSLGGALSVQRSPDPVDRPLVILAAGDSMTAAGYPDELQALCDAARLKVRVVNAGVKGHTSGEYLAYLRASGALARTRPDVVLLQLGTNDVRIDGDRTETARFYRQMNEILDRVLAQPTPRGEAPAVFLSTIPPVVVTIPRHFDASSARRVVEEINPTIRRLARERDLPLVETYELFVRHPGWLPDIHPTAEGYRAMARRWLEALTPLITRRAA